VPVDFRLYLPKDGPTTTRDARPLGIPTRDSHLKTKAVLAIEIVKAAKSAAFDSIGSARTRDMGSRSRILRRLNQARRDVRCRRSQKSIIAFTDPTKLLQSLRHG